MYIIPVIGYTFLPTNSIGEPKIKSDKITKEIDFLVNWEIQGPIDKLVDKGIFLIYPRL